MCHSGPHARPPTKHLLGMSSTRDAAASVCHVSQQEQLSKVPRGSSFFLGQSLETKNQPTHVAADPGHRVPIPGGEAPREWQGSRTEPATPRQSGARAADVGVDPRAVLSMLLSLGGSSDKENAGKRESPMHHFRLAPAPVAGTLRREPGTGYDGSVPELEGRGV